MNSLGEASCRLESVHNYINKDMERLTSHVRCKRPVSKYASWHGVQSVSRHINT